MFWSPENEGESLNIIPTELFVAETGHIRTRIVELTEPVILADLEEMSRRAAGSVKIVIDESGRTFGVQHPRVTDYSETKGGFIAIKNIGRIGPIKNVIHIIRDIYELPLQELSEILTYSSSHIVFSPNGAFRLKVNIAFKGFIQSANPMIHLDTILKERFSVEDSVELLDINKSKLKDELQKQKDQLLEYKGLKTFVTNKVYDSKRITELTEDQQRKLQNILVSVDRQLVCQVLSNITKTPIKGILTMTPYDSIKAEVISQTMPLIDRDTVLIKVEEAIGICERNAAAYEWELTTLENHRNKLDDEDYYGIIQPSTFEYLLNLAQFYINEHSKFENEEWWAQMRKSIIKRKLQSEDLSNIKDFLIPIPTETLRSFLI